MQKQDHRFGCSPSVLFTVDSIDLFVCVPSSKVERKQAKKKPKLNFDSTNIAMRK